MSSTKAEQYKQAVESWKRTPWPCYSLTPRPSPAQGNAAFAERDLDLALANFSTAIQLDPATAAYPLNRAAVYLKLREWTRAERDATTALELDGGVNLKAWFRRAVARRNLGNWELAKQGGLDLVPDWRTEVLTLRNPRRSQTSKMRNDTEQAQTSMQNSPLFSSNSDLRRLNPVGMRSSIRNRCGLAVAARGFRQER
jgi:tetratricopeptide (TPR) repeat protein